MKSVFKTLTHHALTKISVSPDRKSIRVIREIRVRQNLRITGLRALSVKSVKSVFKTFTHHALTKISVSPDRKSIRVIREIRVQEPYASRINKDIRVSRQKKNPCSDLPSNCLETRIVHCFVGSGQFF